MALKTFNINESVYKSYSKHCKKNGVSMSKQVENFLIGEIEKITNVDSKEDIDIKRIEKASEKFDKSIEHPLKKYC
ncbi:hypothetical protein J4229_01380 [Candidatus Pacearchaeota archaeon]|nr:hypothetical protein [Candidatus Pacearchaeota archaeon]